MAPVLIKFKLFHISLSRLELYFQIWNQLDVRSERQVHYRWYTSVFFHVNQQTFSRYNTWIMQQRSAERKAFAIFLYINEPWKRYLPSVRIGDRRNHFHTWNRSFFPTIRSHEGTFYGWKLSVKICIPKEREKKKIKVLQQGKFFSSINKLILARKNVRAAWSCSVMTISFAWPRSLSLSVKIAPVLKHPRYFWFRGLQRDITCQPFEFRSLSLPLAHVLSLMLASETILT